MKAGSKHLCFDLKNRVWRPEAVITTRKMTHDYRNIAYASAAFLSQGKNAQLQIAFVKKSLLEANPLLDQVGIRLLVKSLISL